VAGTPAGVSLARYPSDPLTFFDFNRALRALPDRSPMPAPLSLAEAASLLPFPFPPARSAQPDRAGVDGDPEQ
jgi:hypothetical protein